MPIHQFKCPEGHVTEKVFLTFGAADGVNEIECPAPVQDEKTGDTVHCGAGAHRVEFSVPCQAHLLGNPDGYFKPSPTKRHSYKHVNAHGNGAKEKR